MVADAEAAQGRGRLAEAEALAKRAVEAAPDHVRAKLVLAMIEARTGRTEEAVAHFQEVVDRDKTSFDAIFWLSMLHRLAGRLPESVEWAERAIGLRPREAHVHSNLGLSLLAAQRLPEAIQSFERASALNPNLAPNLHQLGVAYQLQARDAEAAQAFRRALALAPNAETMLALGQSLMNQGDSQGAADCARRALKLNPNAAAAHLLLAGALIEEGRTAEAEAPLRAAMNLNPADSSAHAMLGMRMQALGRLGEANASFRKSIEIQPEQGFAYCALVRNQKVDEGDRQTLERMEGLIAAGALPPRGLSYLHYGLGKAYEDLRDYERAMRHFDEANRLAYRLKFGDRPFDKKRYAAAIDWAIETFTPAFFEKYREAGSESDAPIFVLGMMRSGTTLVEQILSRHPDVEATGEQPFWMARGAEAARPPSKTLNVVRLKELEAQYLKTLRALAPEAARFTDKMPGNYLFLGPIHAAFPNARIFHTRRDPRDTCLSIYTTPNRTANEYAHDRENIVFAYEQYRRLMDHWRRVLPADRLFEVDYEALVSDRERLTREMVAFAGLEWHDACLRPEENERSVVTPSVWQVRQPVYKTSVARWRNYEPWLGAFGRL